jgi:addiction module HigA family antidote
MASSRAYQQACPAKFLPTSSRLLASPQQSLPARLTYQQTASRKIIAGKRSVTADTALRLGRYFGSSADLWMNLQKIYDLDLATKALGKAINKIPQRPVEPTGTRA